MVVCACPETTAITVSIAMRFPGCWAVRERKKQKIQVIFPPLLLPLLVSFFFSFLSFDKKHRASLEILCLYLVCVSSLWAAFEFRLGDI